MSDLRLILFDVDGTLVDSQADIVGSMAEAFAAVDMPAPSRSAILGIVGLSLPQAMARLAPGRDEAQLDRMVDAYKEAYFARRAAKGSKAASPLYPHVAEILEQLGARDDLILGTATGKSRRGLDALVDAFDIRRHFTTLQCADDHPSKPHPSMIETAMAETGIAARSTVMIGDTSFDMDMARAAGVTPLAVSWGYHPRGLLRASGGILDDIRDLPAWIDNTWSST
ncbi:HAD-IA family hydrolase [Pseudaestuariivita atlantica]|uniref:HAD family hydrolase n=1 Tax=Pseudaestuariivita atlantica TaxID=1317121 RepID=A0A0L1JKK1_9RHOB|nr:HAD-IA family hydrolase [Pseudaestuariivita atlantica]KNG92289.1 HAD family hydrolase [Pseudaestuariivita atlantica]